MDNFRRKAVISLISSYITQFATTGINFGMKIVLGWLLLPKDFGLYAEASLLLMGCDLLIDFGIAQHLTREKNRPYGNVLMFRMLVALALFVLIQIVADQLAFWDPRLPAVMRVLAVIPILKAASQVPVVFFDRELQVQRSILPTMSRLALLAGISIILARMDYGVWALVYGAIAGEIAFTLLIWRAAYGRIPLEWTWSHTRRMLWGSRYLFLISILGLTLQQGDIAIIGTVLNPEQVGLYGMAYMLIMQISKVVEQAVYRVIYPTFCEYKDDLRNLGRLYRKATLAITAAEAPMYFYLLFNAPMVVKVLLPDGWLPAAALIQGLSVFGIINPFSTFGNEVLRARNQDKILILSTVIGSLTLMIGGYFLTRKYGTMGMVAANYFIIGSIPSIIMVYKTLKSDFRKLAGQLAVVYVTSLGVMTLISVALPLSPQVRALVAGLFVPVCWYTYYRVYGNGLGGKTIGALLSSRSPAQA